MIANLKYNKSTNELTIVDKEGDEISLQAEITSDTSTRVLFKIECHDDPVDNDLPEGIADGD
tara:strand:- start:4302 stop:4487 length:186 start_codon:yes stop_codon:yes gene_type:complete